MPSAVSDLATRQVIAQGPVHMWQFQPWEAPQLSVQMNVQHIGALSSLEKWPNDWMKDEGPFHFHFCTFARVFILL